MNVTTIVFLDVEATGLPEEESNQTEITELSLIAVNRKHLISTNKGEVPRVQHKLTLCFNPQRQIKAIASAMSGLNNDLLKGESIFDQETVNIINNFFKRLQKPLCLIAHFGTGLDFPVLKNHLERLYASLDNTILYTDSLSAFKSLLPFLPSYKLSEVYKQLPGASL